MCAMFEAQGNIKIEVEGSNFFMLDGSPKSWVNVHGTGAAV